jgi:ABC-type uncharacterized transport system substrate-binding protein
MIFRSTYLTVLGFACLGWLALGGVTFGQQRPAKLVLIRYNEAADAASGELAIKAGLLKVGLEDGADYEMKVTSAQNDLPTLFNLIDAAISDKADVLIPLQSMTLQPTVQKAKNLPIVFHLVSDPILLGIAKSDTDHLDNVTGAYIQTQPSEFDMLLGQVRASLVGAKKVATLFVPGEIISSSQKDILTRRAKQLQMEVNAVPVDTVSDLPNAIQAMLSGKPDAIVMVEGSVPNGAFGAIVAAADRAKVPVFGFTAHQVRNGAVFAIVPDVGRGGEAVGEMIKKILDGTSPKNLPLYRMPSGLKLVNSKAARKLGLDLSPDTVKGAIDIVGP